MNVDDLVKKYARGGWPPTPPGRDGWMDKLGGLLFFGGMAVFAVVAVVREVIGQHP